MNSFFQLMFGFSSFSALGLNFDFLFTSDFGANSPGPALTLRSLLLLTPARCWVGGHGSPFSFESGRKASEAAVFVVNKPWNYQDESNAVFLPKNTQKNISQTW